MTDKHTVEGVTEEGLPFGVSSMQGWRVHMEDAHIAERNIYAAVLAEENGSTKYHKLHLPGHALFAVFDGHGGTFAAVYSGQNLLRVLSRQSKFIEYAKFELEREQKEKEITNAGERMSYLRSGLELLEVALCHALVDLDREIALALKGTKVADADTPYHDDENLSGGVMSTSSDGDAMQGVTPEPEGSPADTALQLLEEEGDSGTTVCIVMLTPGHVVCANAGDSRAVLSRLGNKAVPLSFDHKPDDDEEERRIRAAGGFVAGGRVQGDLAVSRGLGDFRFKNMDVVMASTDAFYPEDPASPEHEIPGRAQMGPGDQKVSPIPDILIQTRNSSQDEFILIACDGIWDVQTNYEAVQTIAALFREGETSIGLVCEEVRSSWEASARGDA